MSFIQVIEQLGSNAALQQLNHSDLNVLFANTDISKSQLEAMLGGDFDNLNKLLQTPLYRCVVQTPAEEQDEPAEEEREKSPTQQSIVLQ